MYTQDQLQELRQHVRPTPGRVAVLLDSAETVSAGGIYLPDAETDSKTGILLAVGPDRPDAPMGLVDGDRAMVSDWAGTPLKIDIGMDKPAEVRIMDAGDVLCVLTKDTKVAGTATTTEAGAA